MIGIFPGGVNLYQYEARTAPPYAGFVGAFHLAQSTVASQLRQMYANGMRWLRLPLEHCHDAEDDGYNLNSTGAVLSGQQLENFTALLSLIRSIGFLGVEVMFGPAWWNAPDKWVNPGDWTDPNFGACVSSPAPGVSLQNGWYSENWNFIVNIRKLLVESGLFFLLDLCNEAIPQPYTKRLWADYTYVYGTDNTVGFSINPMPAWIAAFPDTYRGIYPRILDVHAYNAPNPYGDGVAAVLNGALGDLAKAGMGNIPYYVGESNYEDADTAACLSTISKPPILVMEWPLTSAALRAGNDLIDVVATDWSVYRTGQVA